MTVMNPDRRTQVPVTRVPATRVPATRIPTARVSTTRLPAVRTGIVRLPVSVDEAGRRGLTRREIEVLTLVAAGCTKQQVSRALGIAPHTVAGHLARIYRALGARNAAHAVALAHGSGAISGRWQPPPGSAVSRRERQVLAGLAHGLTSEQMAWCLSLSSETVKTHLQRIYRKLDVRSRANAVDAAIRRRLLAVVLEPRG